MFCSASLCLVTGAENSLPVFVSEAGRARVMRCTDPEAQETVQNPSGIEL